MNVFVALFRDLKLRFVADLPYALACDPRNSKTREISFNEEAYSLFKVFKGV